MGKILRRTFLIGTAAIAGGVAFGAYKVLETPENPLEAKRGSGENPFNPYVTITDNDVVSVYVPRSEMGQGVATTLVALVAEELDVPVERIRTLIAPASDAYFNSTMMHELVPFGHLDRGVLAQSSRAATRAVGKIFGIQATGGSSSTRDAFEPMRRAGAAARETLKLAAAEQFSIAVDRLSTADGAVELPDGTRLTYGSLAQAASALEPPTDIELRDPSTWTVLGKSQPRTDMRAKVTGAPIFGMDVDLPDMLYATIKMNPRLGGPMLSFNAREARKVRGVIDVIDISRDGEPFGGGFAVVAQDTWTAFKAAELVDVEWGEAPYPSTTDAIMEQIGDALDNGSGFHPRNDGDVDTAFADARRDRVIEARYQVPYLAHATMEPMNATALLSADGERLDIWAGTQAPTIALEDCAHEAGVAEENTFVKITYLGGGFGRRVEVDFVRYATRIAKAFPGRPVKTVWSREEDMTHDAYRPAAMSSWRALLGDDGVPVAIDARIACPSIMKSALDRFYPSLFAVGPDSSIAQGAYDQPYSVENYRVSDIIADVAVPVGIWRSVGNSYNGFFQESFIDECAHAAEMDPLDMRLALMKDYPTAQAAIKKVADMARWSAPATPGRAKGMAFTLSFGTWVAQVVEVESRDDGIAITNVWCAADSGRVIDPGICKAQLMSGIVFGLSSALGQAITFEDGMVQETNFDTFDAMRIDQCPDIHIELLENADHMGGMGEPGTPPSIPALANAIFALTGERVRSMPLSDSMDFV
jgi:isoquinoline 1-oxidoreductase beta subunit